MPLILGISLLCLKGPLVSRKLINALALDSVSPATCMSSVSGAVFRLTPTMLTTSDTTSFSISSNLLEFKSC
uniref:Putative secreted protein n=1 Tax=Panstrongylus lignarius TaxID=156445 RepID=A0A224XU72_9HEMI